MNIFNFDEDTILDSISNALEEAGYNASQDQMTSIINAIDEKFPSIIEILTYGMQSHWKDEARNSGLGWGEKYANAIKAEVSGGVGEIYIDEDMLDKQTNKPSIMFANMVEYGMKSFSIKDALMASEKAKVSADGVKYMTVPFPVATPRKASQGKMASKFGGREMTEEMHKVIKSGGRISGKLKSGQEVSGLSRYVTQQRHSQYGIFIRVSEKSKGWIHPGVAASPVFPNVIKEVNKRVQEIISSFCKEIGKQYTS